MRLLLDDVTVKEWIAVCLNCSPVNVPIDTAISDTLSHILHGTGRGFQKHHDLFLTGGTHLVPPRSADPAAMTLEPEE